MRRFSKILHPNNGRNDSDKNKERITNGDTPTANGTSTNGEYSNGVASDEDTTNGVADGTNKQKRRSLPFNRTKTGASSKYPDPPDHNSSRLDIEGSLHSLWNLVDHSMRPVPTAGDGTYDQEDVHPSKLQELRTIGFKDVKTLRDQFMAGTGPIDDKTMLVS